MNCDINIYEGMKVRGNAEYVIRGGEIVIENGLMADSQEHGKYLFRTIK